MEKPFSSSGLFVRQASGLVRDVSMTNALFFNVAAFVGTAVGWAIVFYALGPEWQALGISAFAWMAVLTGIACFFLGLIFASLTTAMPRSGGDYVFTSRIIGPFWGWIESWTLVGSALTIIGFEIIVATHNIQLIGIMLGQVFPGSAFGNAQNWFGDNLSKAIAGIVIMLIIGFISILRTRTFHKVVTGLSIFAIVAVAISFFGSFALSPSQVDAALPSIGTSHKAIVDAATQLGWSLGSPNFSFNPGLIGLAGLVSVVLFQYIGFQFSSYIAGEVKGNVRRTVFFAVIGALIFAVFMNSLYQDVIGTHAGFELVNAWGYLYWNGGAAPLNGQPPFSPLIQLMVYPNLWPLWIIVALGNVTLNVLLCPVYAIFLSRIVLAWALDRQVPEWFSVVNERTNAPLRVIIIAVLIGAIFYVLTFFGVSLASTTFFGILLAGLTWIMPGVNAILIPYRRPDLFQLTKNTGKFLGLPRLVWYGILWLIFILPVYAAAFIWPVYQGFQTSGVGYLSLSNTSGVGAALALLVVGLIVYFVMKAINNSKGVNTKMMFQELPPD